MGHYQTIECRAPLSDFGIKLLDYLAEEGVEWCNAADVLWPFAETIQLLEGLLPLRDGPFPLLAQRHGAFLVLDGEYKWGRWCPDPSDAWERALPFLIRDPVEFRTYHELWYAPRVTRLEPTPPTSAHASEVGL